jgi:eight-cysteine-cluster-containing protein
MKLAIITLIILLSACVQPADRNTSDLGGFCGWSTSASCATDNDCKAGGCSGQVCEAKDENIVTTCEYRECYDDEKYGVKCGCVSNECKWYK